MASIYFEPDEVGHPERPERTHVISDIAFADLVQQLRRFQVVNVELDHHGHGHLIDDHNVEWVAGGPR